jgi:flagellar biosynthesis/type III secretory pathway M-ring protein FliF/YscJ
MAALLVPLSSLGVEMCGSWQPVFLIAAAFNGLTALLALLALKPLARRWRERTSHQDAAKDAMNVEKTEIIGEVVDRAKLTSTKKVHYPGNDADGCS